MPKKLDVYLHRRLVGKLFLNADGQMAFDYAEDWVTDARAIPLSHSLPLTKKHFNRKECRGYFAGILPDASKREVIARNLGISARNDFAMLERIGGECAGAVTFVPEGASLPESSYAYRPLGHSELAAIIEKLPRRPLLAGEEGIRLSLAGAQDKIAVHVSGAQISLPLNGAPSTHILKPAIDVFEGIVFDEALCMHLAEAVGLDVAKVEVGKVGAFDYLLIQRYDRAPNPEAPDHPKHLRREHQEDFCQALGIVPERKYQNEGGPSIKQCFDLVRATSSIPVVDLRTLLDAIIFNWLIGNNDAHAKNFSLIYPGIANARVQTRLAPLYDLISTVYYPDLSPKMAMKLGREYHCERITPTHFERVAEEVGLAKPMMRERVLDLAEAILGKLPIVTTDHPVTRAVAKLIQNRCERSIRIFAA
jgi:serine/threonine-protein kinase HipA